VCNVLPPSRFLVIGSAMMSSRPFSFRDDLSLTVPASFRLARLLAPVPRTSQSSFFPPIRLWTNSPPKSHPSFTCVSLCTFDSPLFCGIFLGGNTPLPVFVPLSPRHLLDLKTFHGCISLDGFRVRTLEHMAMPPIFFDLLLRRMVWTHHLPRRPHHHVFP